MTSWLINDIMMAKALASVAPRGNSLPYPGTIQPQARQTPDHTMEHSQGISTCNLQAVQKKKQHGWQGLAHWRKGNNHIAYWMCACGRWARAVAVAGHRDIVG